MWEEEESCAVAAAAAEDAMFAKRSLSGRIDVSEISICDLSVKSRKRKRDEVVVSNPIYLLRKERVTILAIQS